MNKLWKKIAAYRSTIITLYIFEGLLYLFYMVNQLTNVGDGFWQQSYYFAGGHELSCGRWLWPYMDKIQRGIHVDPLTSLIALGFIVFGCVLAMAALDIPDNKACIFGGAVFLSSPVLSATVSYRYMAVIFALAFLLSVAGAYAGIKTSKNVPAILVSAILLCCSMGLYQAFAGAFCLLFMISIIILAMDDEAELSQLGMRILRFAASFILGGALYYLILNIHLKVQGVHMNSYQGADDVSILNILRSFPGTFMKTYSLFREYCAGDILYINELDSKVPVSAIYHVLLCAVFAAVIVWYAVKNHKKGIMVYVRTALSLLCFVLIPAGCNVASILAPESGFMPQMGGAMALFSGVIPATVISRIKREDGKRLVVAVVYIAALVVCGFIAYGQSAQVLIDHMMMKDGYTASVSMANGIVDDLRTKGLLSPDRSYYFIGTPAHNEMFAKTEVYDKANQYAKIGNFWLTDSNMYASYTSLFNRVMGIDLNVSSDSYESKAYDDYYKTVPCYPEEGYILAWDTVIIKVSEP